MAETSTKPYMIRALYEWCCDNGYTPYLAVAVDEHTLVPRQHVKAGEIVLNVSPMATSRLTLGNELVEFQARFSGVAQQISVPIGNISAIYARETGHGMAFDVSKATAVTDEQGHPEAGRVATHPVQRTDDQGRDHAPGSSVQSLRGGPRRRGPRSVDRDDSMGTVHRPSRHTAADGNNQVVQADASESDAEDQAANSRKRSSNEQASADVLAFKPSGVSRKKKSGSAPSRSKSDEAADEPSAAEENPDDDNEDPPPPDGGSQGGKGGKARLTRVK